MQILRFHNRAIVVPDEAMSQTIDRANRAAAVASPVLLVGESGTGKELIARFVHDRSDRAKKRFVSVNCAAIPEGLMEAELFGFERGAFTGALQQRIGKFEQASHGTLLLDEISEMSYGLQAKLLRVLQENEIDRLGGKDPIPVNTRIIATTNRDPLKLIEEGLFREDLFFRLNVIRIDCAPLRKRGRAIESLSEVFLDDFIKANALSRKQLSPAAKDKLVSYGWPGNVRELKNCIERAVLLCDGHSIAPEHLDGLRAYAKAGINSDGGTLAELEQKHILETLERTGGNRTSTAEKLGISVRTLRNKLREYSHE